MQHLSLGQKVSGILAGFWRDLGGILAGSAEWETSSAEGEHFSEKVSGILAGFWRDFGGLR